MLFLIPPSETKRIGGTLPCLDQIALPFNQLSSARESVISAVMKVSKQKNAAKLLKVPKSQLALIDENTRLLSAQTIPAIERYIGTLYDAIAVESLTEKQRARAGEQVLIQSALFGLVSANAPIPNYRFSATISLPKLDLKKTWAQAHQTVFARLAPNAPIIDLRSKSYADLAPVPEHIPHFWVEVVTRVNGSETRALNHFNKKSKGELIRAVLQSEARVESIDQLKTVAKIIGFELVEISDRFMQLVV